MKNKVNLFFHLISIPAQSFLLGVFFERHYWGWIAFSLSFISFAVYNAFLILKENNISFN